MAYKALYREFRPKSFSEISGQAHITVTLRNQIKTGHISHAYLFCGARGTGKTSTAKIFARALNCLSPENGEACGVCESCKIMQENDIDILEIDAASNNRVEEMRKVIDEVPYSSLHLNYKVYIIDEVHMLSSSAANAILKTLEEPPKHVVFILATTEPQKVLPTVISRCQRFDFWRLSVTDIVENLRQILSKVGAKVDDEGLYIVARAADGGMRDALSILDQCLAFCGDDVSKSDVLDILGAMDSGFLFDIAEALLRSDMRASLKMLDDIAVKGRSLGVFVQDIIEHMRALLLAKTLGDCHELLECTTDTMKKYTNQAETADESRLLRAIEILSKTQAEMKWVSQPRIYIETALVRICRPEDESGLIAIEDRLNMLERQERASLGPINVNSNASNTAEQLSPPVYVATSISEPIEKPVKPPKSKTQANNGAVVLQSEIKPDVQEHAEESSEAQRIWAELKKMLQSASASVYVLAASAKRVYIDGTIFTLEFLKNKEAAAAALKNTRSKEVLQSSLERIAPGKQIEIVVRDEAADEKTEELIRLFGEKLNIE